MIIRDLHISLHRRSESRTTSFLITYFNFYFVMSRMKDFFKQCVRVCQLGWAYIQAVGVLVRSLKFNLFIEFPPHSVVEK